MNDARSFQRLAAIMAILSAVLSFASMFIMLAAVNFDLAVAFDPDALLEAGSGAASGFRSGMMAYLFGYFLLLAPAVLFVGSWLEPRSPNWVRLSTFFGLVYVLLGAVGAAALYAVVPGLMDAYAQAPAGQRESLQMLNRTFSDLIYSGLLGLVQLLPGGIWWLVIGVVLRAERRILGGYTLALGIIVVVTPWFAGGAAPGIIGETLLMLWSLLAPIWALWLGIDLLRRPAVEAEQEGRAPGGLVGARPA